MNDIDRLSALLQAQAQRCCLFDQRISVLESMMPPPMPYEGDTMTHEPPPAPLVERMAEAMLRGRHDDVPASAGVRSLYRDDARAALRVAAEELLGPVTDKERTAIAARSDALQATEDVLRCRLAAALEACR